MYNFSPHSPLIEIRNFSFFDKSEKLLSKEVCVEIVDETEMSVKVISRFDLSYEL